MVLVVSSNTLQDSIIKSVLNEYEIKSQEISPEDFDYNGEVLEPPYDVTVLKTLRESSGLHDICIRTKCEDAIYSGKKIVSKNGQDIPPELEEFLENFLTDEECESFLNDLETYAFAGLEILRDDTLQFKGINHVPSLYLRMCEDKDKVIQKIGTHYTYFKVYDPDNKNNLNKVTGRWNENIDSDTVANELLWFNSKSDQSRVYGEPAYLSEVDAILTDNAIVEYQLGHFKSKGVPNYIITITGNIDETEDYTTEDFEDDLKKEFGEITNEPGTALVLCIPSTENNLQVNVHKIGEEMKEGSFLELSESNADRIYRIHKVPRERLGEGKSSGIASNRTEMLLKTYSKSTVGKLQKRMASYINNTIIKYEFESNDHKLQYLPANFDEEEALLDRGLKLLQNGAMTLGEFINRFGEPFELHMDENDELFNVRFMNNQELKNVIFGDNAPNTEEQLQDMINNLQEEMNVH